MHTSMSSDCYLGAHFSMYKPTKTDYNNIMQENQNRINMWHCKLSLKSWEINISIDQSGSSACLCVLLLPPTPENLQPT